MRRLRSRPVQLQVISAVVLATALVLSPMWAGSATAAVLGAPDIVVHGGGSTGADESLFSGSIGDARCPRGTVDSYWTVDGPDLPPDQAFLAPGNVTGTGPQEFRGASIANLRANNSGSFSRDGVYTIRFNCVRSDGKVSDTYDRRLRYVAGGAGTFTVEAVPAHLRLAAGSGAPAGTAPTAVAGGSLGTSAQSTPSAIASATEGLAAELGDQRAATSASDSWTALGGVAGLLVLLGGLGLVLLARRKRWFGLGGRA